jgi:hypothetical protein
MNERLLKGYDIVFVIPPVRDTPANGKVDTERSLKNTSEPSKPK